MPDWIEITANGPGETKDLASFILIKAGSPGVMEAAEQPKELLVSYSRWEDETKEDEAPQTGVASFKAYLPSSDGSLLEDIKKELGEIGWAFTSATFADQDWSEKWKEHIRPIRVRAAGASIVIKPTWRSFKKSPGEIIIEMDPGMAFGTGSHATTKMCLRAVAVLVKSEKSVKKSILDIGTGTGILAIAAKKLGIRKAVGTDIDPVAVKSARKNAALNKTKIELTGKPLERLKGKYPLVVANILAGDLKRLGPSIFDKTSPGGFVVLSGILKEEAGSVREAFRGFGFKPVRKYSTKEWAALILKRPK